MEIIVSTEYGGEIARYPVTNPDYLDYEIVQLITQHKYIPEAGDHIHITSDED